MYIYIYSLYIYIQIHAHVYTYILVITCLICVLIGVFDGPIMTYPSQEDEKTSAI